MRFFFLRKDLSGYSICFSGRRSSRQLSLSPPSPRQPSPRLGENAADRAFLAWSWSGRPPGRFKTLRRMIVRIRFAYPPHPQCLSIRLIAYRKPPEFLGLQDGREGADGNRNRKVTGNLLAVPDERHERHENLPVDVPSSLLFLRQQITHRNGRKI